MVGDPRRVSLCRVRRFPSASADSQTKRNIRFYRRFSLLHFFGGLPFDSVFQSVLRQSAVLRSRACDRRLYGVAVYGKPLGNDAFVKADKTDKKAFNFDKNAR